MALDKAIRKQKNLLNELRVTLDYYGVNKDSKYWDYLDDTDTAPSYGPNDYILAYNAGVVLERALSRLHEEQTTVSRLYVRQPIPGVSGGSWSYADIIQLSIERNVPIWKAIQLLLKLDNDEAKDKAHYIKSIICSEGLCRNKE